MAEADDLDAGVRGLAEFLYECGFPPGLALDAAWSLARLPELEKEVLGDDC